MKGLLVVAHGGLEEKLHRSGGQSLRDNSKEMWSAPKETKQYTKDAPLRLLWQAVRQRFKNG